MRPRDLQEMRFRAARRGEAARSGTMFPSAKRPEKALLGLRAALGLFVNLRPAQMHKALADACRSSLRLLVTASTFSFAVS